MTAFASDTFTDTNGTTLASHTPTTSGGTWSRLAAQSNSGSAQIAGGARVRANADGADQLYLLSATNPAGTADYDLTVTIDVQTNGGHAGGLARWSSSSALGYYFFYDGGSFTSSGYIRLWRYGGSGTASLGSYNCGTLSGTHDLKIEMRGTAIKVYLDGTERISVTETSITAANQVGLRVSSASSTGDSANAQITTLIADDIMPVSPALAVSAALPAPAVAATTPDATVTVPALAVAASMSAPVVVGASAGDDFTEASNTAITSHTPTGTYATGGTWSTVTNIDTGVATVNASADQVYPSSTAGGVASSNHLLSYSPASADYYVSADFVVATNTGYGGLFGRWIAADAYTGYSVYYKATSSPAIIELAGYSIATGGVVIGTYSCGDLTGTHNLKLRMVGTTISVDLDGTQVISVTDTKASAAGKGGIRQAAQATPGTTGINIDNFLMGELTVAASRTAPALAVSAALPAPTVSGTGDTTIVVSTLSFPLLLGDIESPLRVAARLPVPPVTATTGSSSASVTAPGLTVTAALPAPAVSGTTGTVVSAVALGVAASLPAPTVTAFSSPNAEVFAVPITTTIALGAPTVPALGAFTTGLSVASVLGHEVGLASVVDVAVTFDSRVSI